jgi:hypothetical protein
MHFEWSHATQGEPRGLYGQAWLGARTCPRPSSSRPRAGSCRPCVPSPHSTAGAAGEDLGSAQLPVTWALEGAATGTRLWLAVGAGAALAVG